MCYTLPGITEFLLVERAIKSLASAPDVELFEEVATGIEHVVEVVTRLDGAAHGLSETGQHHPARILGNLAEEEAAKVLILVDAVRCPRQKQADKSRTLGYFYEHLAKGIYAQVCHWRPVNFDEVAQGVDDERVEHYLDGPLDVDWIFPNSIKQHREDDLYVGYVRDDSEQAGHGKSYWVYPQDYDLIRYWTQPIVHVARALRQV